MIKKKEDEYVVWSGLFRNKQKMNFVVFFVVVKTFLLKREPTPEYPVIENTKLKILKKNKILIEILYLREQARTS